jgi:hypothetical protein
MDLYTLPPVYSTPSMMTPAYSEYPANSPILSLYYSYTHTPISSLPLSIHTSITPLRDMAICGDSIYSPSTVMYSLPTMPSPSTGTHHTGISLYRMKEECTLSPLYTVTLPLRDTVHSPIHSHVTNILVTVLSALSNSCDANCFTICKMVVLIDAEYGFSSIKASRDKSFETNNTPLEATYTLSFYNDMSLMIEDEKTFTEAFLFQCKTILSRDESLVESFASEFLAIEKVFIEDDFFSVMYQLMDNLASNLLLREAVTASNSFLGESFTPSDEVAGRGFAVSDFDIETCLSGDDSAGDEKALWESFFRSLLPDSTANRIDDNYLVIPAMEHSTTDGSM